ncbi:MAG TPA: STAS domain-containing protein [Terriglobales bacterium]|nr:STAS domain-containing protein [Terriglobales bacterium]
MRSDSIRMEYSRDRLGRGVLRLTGPLTLNNLFGFQREVRADSSVLLIIEFSGVPYIDSAGLGALIGAQVSRQKDGRQLVLAGVTDRVLSTLRMTNVEQFFTIVPGLEDTESSAS